MKEHQDHTRTFEELNYKEQAQSINAQIANLGRAVNAHLRRAAIEGRDSDKVREKCVKASLGTGQTHTRISGRRITIRSSGFLPAPKVCAG